MIRRRLLAWSSLIPALGLGGALLPAGAQTARGSRRVALVIGNAQYSQAPLVNPENDARLVATTMSALGFEVDVQYNLKARDFKRVLRDFGRRMEDDDSAAVFFYAGHGMQIDRRNYLLPVDLNLRDEGEVKDEAIDLEEALLSRIDRVRPRARIFIIDACRDNPFADRTRGLRSSAGLAEMAAPGALIAFSAAPGRTAEDGPPGTNSIYTRLLAQEMRVEGVEVEEMLKNVRVKVLRETKERQIPWVNTSMVVNFAFNPGGVAGAAMARATVLAPAPAAVPRPEAPKAEVTRSEVSKSEVSKPDLSKSEVSRSEAPSADTPRLEARSDVGGPVRSLRLRIQAESSLNTDKRQASASLALRVYVLRDDQAFQRANFDSLYDNDEAVLGAAVLRRESLHLRPGESRELVLTLGKEAHLVAVFAAYRELDRAQWRTVLVLPSDDIVPVARLNAQARQVQLGWVQ